MNVHSASAARSCVAAVCGWAALVGAAAAQDAGVVASPAVAARLGAVSESELRAHIERLTGLADVTTPAGPRRIRSRSVSHADVEIARDYLAERLSALGLDVRREGVAQDGGVADGGATMPSLANVEGTLRGTGAPGEVYVVSAHYDSTAKLTRGWNAMSDPAPGADDNASGTALVLEAARVLRDSRPRATIRFVLFTAEEVGIVGSAVYARAARARGDDIRVALSMDPVGNTGPLAGSLYFTYNRDSEDVARAAETVPARYSLSIPVYAIPGDSPLFVDDRSDHQAFWGEHYRAVHGGTLPGDAYHTLEDTLSKVDLPFLAQATRVVVAMLAEAAGPIASAAPPLAARGSGCAVHAADRRVPNEGVLIAWLLVLAVVLRARAVRFI